ncbi:MAG: hypothetical protein J6O17_05015 [Eubacterium sp.]|nr:hypothetical protein [Eubacterium sp.]
MQDKKKLFVTVNIFSLIMFFMCILLIFFTDFLGIGIAGSVLWLLYTVIANKYVLSGDTSEEKEISWEKRLLKSDSKGLFKKEVASLLRQYNSIRSREDYMMRSSSSMQDLYQKILEQAESNIDSAAAYIESYDYYTKPDPAYLKGIVKDGDVLVERFNTLIQKMVDIETNPTTLDMKYVDDVTDLLDELQEHRQVMTS